MGCHFENNSRVLGISTKIIKLLTSQFSDSQYSPGTVGLHLALALSLNKKQQSRVSGDIELAD